VASWKLASEGDRGAPLITTHRVVGSLDVSGGPCGAPLTCWPVANIEFVAWANM